MRSTRISTKTSTTTAPSITTTEDYYDDEYSDPWPDYFGEFYTFVRLFHRSSSDNEPFTFVLKMGGSSLNGRAIKA